MTIREFYEHVLTELNKVEAPSLLLEDFNYFANKAVQQYINEVYNRYDINQQATDDLRALKVSKQEKILESKITNSQSYFPGENNGYYVALPSDYLHILNCIVTFEAASNNKGCGSVDNKSQVHSMARRLTSDMFPSILNNAYLKPSYKCPYYFINNTNYDVEDNHAEKLSKILEGIDVDNNSEDSTCRIELRCGDTSKYTPIKVYFDYIKTPTPISLTYDDLDAEQYSTQMEFPEYVCYEIVNKFVKLALENASDPRLETNIPVNQTIAGTVNNN